jgi:hypothetical protein
VASCRALNVTPHVAQNERRPGGSALDLHTTNWPGYVASQRVRAFGVTEPGLFAGALLRQPRFRIGRGLVGCDLAPFAVEVHARIAWIIGRSTIGRLLALGA